MILSANKPVTMKKEEINVSNNVVVRLSLKALRGLTKSRKHVLILARKDARKIRNQRLMNNVCCNV